MREMPVIELRVKHFGEQLHAMVALHNEELEQYIQQGVDRALANLGETLITEASAEATKRIHQEIITYFTWGEGATAIREAIQHALEPIAVLLRRGIATDE